MRNCTRFAFPRRLGNMGMKIPAISAPASSEPPRPGTWPRPEARRRSSTASRARGWRPASPMPASSATVSLALGRPRHSAKGHQMAADDRWAAGAAPQARSWHVDLGPAAAGQLHREGLRAQQVAHGAARRILARPDDCAQGRDRPRLRWSPAGHAAAVPRSRSSSTMPATTSRC